MSNALQQVISPKGELEWVFIDGEGKEDLQGNHKYSVTLVLDPDNNEEHQAFIDKIEAFWEDNKPKGFRKEAKSMGFYPHKEKTDETDENGEPIYAETGKTIVVFKTGTAYRDGKPKVVKIFNAKANEVQLGDKKIGNGTVAKVGGAIAIYTVESKGKVMDAGVTCYLDRLQIFKLEEYVAGAGFEADESEEDGWTGDEDSFEGEPKEEKAAPAKGKAQPKL